MKRNITLSLLGIFAICALALAQDNRSFDGTGNNATNPTWGAADTHFRTFVTVSYSDGISEPAGVDRPNPRAVSNAIGSQSEFIPNELGLSDFVWGWGQFIDHDINLNDDQPAEVFNIDVPNCDPEFDPMCTGTAQMRMFRSISDPATGTSTSNPRRHINDITSFIDGSMVYGSDVDRDNWLRTFVDGKFKMAASGLLPWNTVDGEFESAIDSSAPFMVLDGIPIDKFFVGGDIRVNEQPGLMCFHTLMVREHNRLAEEIALANPSWTDEDIFQRARKIVGGLIQAVTYEEFLPQIGVNIAPYSAYDDNVDASIINVFSAAGYRFGHTLINGRLLRYEENGDVFSFGAQDLRDGFFVPAILKDEGGIEPFFRGMAAQEHQMVDPMIMDDIRNFLFGPPGAGGIDLLSINLARARERGLPDYNTIRVDLGLTAHTDFASLTSDTDVATALENVYGTIDKVDPWIGFMSEDHLSNALMGEGLNTLLTMQFTALRDGDRYYYENDTNFTQDEIDEIKNTKLSEIILRNTSIEVLQDNVFDAVPRETLGIELFPFAGVTNIDIKAYPNPVQKNFNLSIQSRHPLEATLNINDVTGKLISTQNVSIQRGSNELAFQLSDAVANGLYVITLVSNQGNGQLKIIKQQ
jgi:hypothetical protein